MSRLALIPPLSMLRDYMSLNYFLYLPQLMSHPDYHDYVKRTAGRSAYTILDNGAFEDELTDPHKLVYLATRYEINELVIPDALRDMAQTLYLLEDFLERTEQQRKHTPYRLSLMAVVQGCTMDECMNCIREFAKHKEITALALPKHLARTVSRTARLQLMNYIEASHGDTYRVHLLGGLPQYPTEVHAAKRYACFRGMDTSLPFFAAYYNRLIMFPSEEERPNKYFTLPRTAFNQAALDTNVSTLLEWSHV